MKEWFLQLAPRERLMVGLGGGVALLVLGYVAIVEPLIQGFAEREQRVERLEQDLAWMSEAAGEVIALRSAGQTGSAPGDTDRPAYLAVDDAVREADLPRPQRLEPDGADTARVDFDRVAFDRLVALLGRLERDAAVQVARARIERIEQGLVSAQLTLERRQP